MEFDCTTDGRQEVGAFFSKLLISSYGESSKVQKKVRKFKKVQILSSTQIITSICNPATPSRVGSLELFSRQESGEGAQGEGKPAGGQAPGGLRRERQEGGAPESTVRVRVSKISNFLQIFCKFLAGSFSAVSKRNFVRKYAFDSIFQALQDLHPFAPLQSQSFRKKNRFEKTANFVKFQQKIANVAIFAKFCQISKISV